MRLDLGIIAGDNTKGFLSDLAKIVERFEKAALSLSGNAPSEVEPEELVAPPKKKTVSSKKVAAPVFEEEEESSSDDAPEIEESEESEEEEEESFVTPPKKAAKSKAPKFTINDVNDACIERSGDKGRANVLSLLKKKFGVESVTELEPDQFEAVIKTMKTGK